MRLSIVIVNWNTTGLLKNCLRSIYACPPDGDFEVIIVDNASKDFDSAAFTREFPDTHLIVNQDNAGYARGNNQGFEIAQGERILLLNPDTEVKEGSINTLLRFLDDHSEAAGVGCKLVRPDGRTDRSCRGFPSPVGVASEYLGLSKIFPGSRFFGSYRMTYFGYDRVSEVDQPMASCFMISRKALEDVGGLDEDFPLFFNDVDWCYRAKQKGWKIYFTPEAEVVHLGGASTKQVKNKAVVESHAALARFYEKHYKGRINPIMYALAMFGIRINMRWLHKPGREI
jgi:GT2 family glycosyltransferase